MATTRAPGGLGSAPFELLAAVSEFVVCAALDENTAEDFAADCARHRLPARRCGQVVLVFVADECWQVDWRSASNGLRYPRITQLL